jgi:hypothetical protein
MRVTITINETDHSAYVSASKLLGELMGREGPSTARLLDHEHTNRSPDGIAEHYDDCFGEPYPRSKKWAKWYGRVLKSGRRWQARRNRKCRTEAAKRPADVTRN